MKTKLLILSGLVLALAGCGDSSSDSKAATAIWLKTSPLLGNCATVRSDPTFISLASTTCNANNLQYLHESRCSNEDQAEVLCGNK